MSAILSYRCLKESGTPPRSTINAVVLSNFRMSSVLPGGQSVTTVHVPIARTSVQSSKTYLAFDPARG
jgi:hypothetical protein